MTPQIFEEILKEFKKRFVNGHGPIANGANDVIEPDAWVDADLEELEGFIWQALHRVREATLDEVKEKLPEPRKSEIKGRIEEGTKIHSFNECLSALHTLLNSLRSNH